MLEVAIVGCGKIAEDHALALASMRDAKLVAACDAEPLMAKQLAERFRIANVYNDVTELLESESLDVVHVTTPPRSHFEITRQCLDANVNVYVEKPFAINAREAAELIRVAGQKGLRLTVGHDHQFGPASRKARELIERGYLGEGPVHMESYYCYPLGKSVYADAVLTDPGHWVRQLPGRLLHNIISHGIGRIAELMETDRPEVIAHGFTSPLLREAGEQEIVDELRVILSERQRRTAYFTFSSGMRPALHQFRVYGTERGFVVDQDQEILVTLDGEAMTSYLERFVSPMKIANRYAKGAATNVFSFLRNKFHMKAGQRFLIRAFYDSIVDQTAPPIPYKDILRTATIMDDIFDQVHPAAESRDSHAFLERT